jgi:fucose 4-O-acetylase-like acetyltransferase
VRQKWIDILKGIAIIAVVLGHTMDTFPDFQVAPVWQHLAFTIPWFIFLSGLTNTLSIRHKPTTHLALSMVRLILRRIFQIVPVYLTALFIAIRLSPYPNQPAAYFFHEAIRFWTVPTFYFVELILELYILFPFLYLLAVKLMHPALKIISVIIIAWLAFYFPWFQIPAWYTGTNITIGGGYLLVFYLGILTGLKTPKESRIFMIITVAVTLLADYLYISRSPSLGHSAEYFVLLHLWSIPLLFSVKFLTRWIPGKIQRGLTYLGRQSLYIFLFHYIILSTIAGHVGENISIIGSFCIFIISLLVPLIPVIIYQKLILFRHN